MLLVGCSLQKQNVVGFVL